jgi:hypothetical protein
VEPELLQTKSFAQGDLSPNWMSTVYDANPAIAGTGGELTDRLGQTRVDADSFIDSSLTSLRRCTEKLLVFCGQWKEFSLLIAH